MRAAMHDPAFAKKMGIPQTVATDFVRADQAQAAGGKKDETPTTNHLGDALRGKSKGQYG